MNSRSVALSMILGCTWAACSPGPMPVSQSTRDPSNPSAAEGIVPPVGSGGPRPSAPPSSSAPTEGHGHHDHTGAPAPTEPAAKSDAGAASAIYTCPMHPEVASPAPGRCPKCGMNLVRKK